MEVIYKNSFLKENLKLVKFTAKEMEIFPGLATKLQVCLSTSFTNITAASFFLNGKTTIFPNKMGLNFEWKENEMRNFILSNESNYDGKILLNIFNVIEGAGGIILNHMYNNKQVKKILKK